MYAAGSPPRATVKFGTARPISRLKPMDPDQPFRELVDELPDLVCRYLADGTLVYVNRAYATYHRQAAEELIGRSFLDLVPDEVRPDVAAALVTLKNLSRQNPVQVNEHRSGDGFGRIRWHQWIDKAVFDDDGNITEFLSAGRDVTERREAEQRIAFTARYDELTGLVNRRAILEELDRAVARATSRARSLGLLFLDLDGFKKINDELGHQAGDEFLAAIGATLAAAVRSDDLVGRIGGDEFVVVCSDIGSFPQLRGAAERLRARLGRMEPQCQASFGAAMLEPGDDGASLLQRADTAMYEEKAYRHASAAYLG